MAKAKKEAEAPAEGADGEKPAKKKRGLVMTLVMFGLPALLVLGGAAYFFLLSGGEEAAEGEHGEAHAEAAAPPVFVDLPDMLVNLTAAGGERAVLKLVVALEVKDAEAAANQAIQEDTAAQAATTMQGADASAAAPAPVAPAEPAHGPAAAH